MRLSLQWLAEWIPLEIPPEALAERLTMGGIEVDAIERSGADLSAFRVGHVLEREAHPNADRLSVCRVDTGEGEPVRVVCGASNVAAGQKVAFAGDGTRLPDGTAIKRSKIRGVVSNGMICSEVELGIGADASGILVLDDAAPVGAALSDVIGSGDVALELSLTPNRGDCASVLGIAREVRAHFGGALCVPETAPREGARAAKDDVRIEIEEPADCHRYAARVVHGVRVGPSPDWLARRLESIGLRPINNVVDVTNLVLFEFGQPTHAFDLATLRGATVRVRAAREGEKLLTLDQEDRELDPDDLVIADAERAIALAGVMGGAETEVRAGTTSVLIESAHFAPARVRRSARRHGLMTEASYRFERGVDRAGVARAADRVARLVAELAGGEVCAGLVEATGAPAETVEEIQLDAERVNRVLGTAIADAEIQALLSRLDIQHRRARGGGDAYRIPTHRNDLARPEDLVEEVGRIYGYDRIPTTLPVAPLGPVHAPPLRAVAEQTRDAFRAAGLLECMMLPFLRSDDLDRLGIGGEDPRRRTVAIANPVLEDEARMESTLVPGLLRAVHRNQTRQIDAVQLFNLSRVFFARGGSTLPEERVAVSAVITRGERVAWYEAQDDRPAPFFQAKGVVERVLRDLSRPAEFAPEWAEPYHHPGASSAVRVEGARVGSVGELHPDVAARFDLEVPCALLELDLSALAAQGAPRTAYAEVSRQPQSSRDLAVLLDRETPAGDVLAAIQQTGGTQLVRTDLFDCYEGTGVPSGKKSLAFRLVFQRHDRTLVEAEVNRLVDRVVKMLGHRFDGELRNAPRREE
ncbi:MAG: phenylalanine--tRNA ligase subunit beta [Deltaproteobacteria bacterium]|nr:MAG: phenylalanine--tRNA ligase subunit beta [Deltaproteobacteria bacterium]